MTMFFPFIISFDCYSSYDVICELLDSLLPHDCIDMYSLAQSEYKDFDFENKHFYVVFIGERPSKKKIKKLLGKYIGLE